MNLSFPVNPARYFLRLQIAGSSDADGDLMADDWELATGTNPLADDSADDPDGDGLGRTLEHLAGRNPLVADSPVDTSDRLLDVHSNFGL